MKHRTSVISVLGTVSIVLVFAFLFMNRREGFQTITTTTDTSIPANSTLANFFVNPPTWLIWLVVVLAILSFVISGLLYAYNVYRGVNTGVTAVRNLSSSGANWMRAKAERNRANAMRQRNSYD